MSNQATTSLPTWLNMKTETELRNVLFKASSTSRLNGPKAVLIDRIVALANELGSHEFSTIFRPFLRWQERNNTMTHQADNRRGNPPRQEAASIRRSSAMTVSVVSERRPEPRRVPIPSASVRASEVLGIVPRAPSRTRVGRGISEVPHAGGVVDSRNTSAQISSRAPGGTRGVDDAGSSVTARLPLPFFRASPSMPPFVSGNRRFVRSPSVLPERSYSNAGTVVSRTPEQLLEESLAAHAGLVIQRITNALTPRRHSSSSVNSPAPTSRYRSASIPSAEKLGPTLTLSPDESSQVNKKLECKICYDAQVNTVLLPCGHACCCEDCSVKVKYATLDSKCPICRARIQSISMLFFS